VNVATVNAAHALSPVQTIAVTGGKGGVGKTNVAANVAIALGLAGRRVLLMDGDLGLGNLDCLLNLKPAFNLAHVMRGERELSEVLLEGPGGIRVIPGASGVMKMARLSQIEHAGLIGLFSDLAIDADTMVIDIATGLSDSVLSFCRAAREVMVVVCDEPTAVQDAFSMIRVLNEVCDVRRFRIVANQTESSRHGLDLYSALTRYTDRHLDVLLDFCGSIPLDSQLKLAVGQQRAVVDHTEFFMERLVQAAVSTR